ncbi:MAG TPA: NAD-dependent succinate-semialdehyde dehydrogenase [Tepidisphaeraceae bacterium]|nr:NAD-dependent succinate-semialdehyde dehydrogenase [Tepidisphaeraceae bacterium]
MLISINPTTARVIAEYPEDSPGEINTKISAAGQAFQSWKKTSYEYRADHFRRLASLLRSRASALALLMAHEMGKPLGAGEAEIEKCAAACDFFAASATDFLKPVSISTEAASSFVRFDPLGPVLAIMPWNFPFWQFFRFAAPALMAGNVAVLKHAPNVSACAAAIENFFLDAHFPAGVVTNLRIADNARAQQIVSHPAIAAVTLTGSERAGMAVAAAAGGSLKKTVMELGGSDPFIVLKDCDVAAVAENAAEARCINSGQSCIAAKRFIVEKPILSAFEQAFAAAMQKRKLGDPTDPATDLGPLARQDLLDTIADQCRRSVAAGARLLIGGQPLPGPGFFFPPTVLTGVGPGMPAFDEETFGPVAAVISADDPQDAVRLANQTRFGLGASIWTSHTDSAVALAAQLDAGNVFINGMVVSDRRLPFGGVKHSGWGRELSELGIREFTNIKTVWIGK